MSNEPKPTGRPTTKVLCMCQGGNVRSVALKYLLHYGGMKLDALACGWESNTDNTRDMLFAWADYIIVMQPQFASRVPAAFHYQPGGPRKLFCYDVGQDRFGNPFHPELQQMLKGMISGHKLFE